MENVNSVVHFEMPYDDGKRMSEFYKKTFGWKTKDLGRAMSNYIQATTTEVNKKGNPVRVGAINGGFYPKKPHWPEQHPSVVNCCH
ncbi:MAG TPA: hypothetical protein VK675_01705 [Candidatus Paceibacterota bacterium]|nr:hypothetical protein [Candidatus Paceibacterota bacterium]